MSMYFLNYQQLRLFDTISYRLFSIGLLFCELLNNSIKVWVSEHNRRIYFASRDQYLYTKRCEINISKVVEGGVRDNISSTKPRKGVSKAGYSISMHMLIYSKSLFLWNPLLAAKLICYFIIYFWKLVSQIWLIVEGNVVSWYVQIYYVQNFKLMLAFEVWKPHWNQKIERKWATQVYFTAKVDEMCSRLR